MNRRNPTSLHHQGTCYLSIFRGPIFPCNFRFLWWTPFYYTGCSIGILKAFQAHYSNTSSGHSFSTFLPTYCQHSQWLKVISKQIYPIYPCGISWYRSFSRDPDFMVLWNNPHITRQWLSSPTNPLNNQGFAFSLLDSPAFYRGTAPGLFLKSISGQ